MSTFLAEALSPDCVFHPDTPMEFEEVVEVSNDLRLAGLVAICAAVRNGAVGSLGGTPAAEELLQTLLEWDTRRRHQFISRPQCLVWIRMTSHAGVGASADNASTPTARHWMAELPSLQKRAIQRDGSHLTLLGSRIDVRRLDVDPLIANVAPPTYDFEGAKSRRHSAESEAYPLESFCNFAETALRRVWSVWPDLGRLFPRGVDTIVHLPDADFRSASASRYSGVVMLGADDYSLLDLEESLVHEFGHQQLYRIMELDPIVLNDSDTEFSLPWSGAERDFYGFFHAFYIYLLLVKYFERVLDDSTYHSQEDRKVARTRLDGISTGLGLAAPEILRAGQFTSVGKKLAHCLAVQASTYASKYGEVHSA